MTETCGNTEYGNSKGYTKLKETLNRLSDVSGAALRVFTKLPNRRRTTALRRQLKK